MVQSPPWADKVVGILLVCVIGLSVHEAGITVCYHELSSVHVAESVSALSLCKQWWDFHLTVLLSTVRSLINEQHQLYYFIRWVSG